MGRPGHHEVMSSRLGKHGEMCVEHGQVDENRNGDQRHGLNGVFQEQLEVTEFPVGQPVKPEISGEQGKAETA